MVYGVYTDGNDNRGIPISDFSFEVFQGSGAFYMRRKCLPQLWSSDTYSFHPIRNRFYFGLQEFIIISKIIGVITQWENFLHEIEVLIVFSFKHFS